MPRKETSVSKQTIRVKKSPRDRLQSLPFTRLIPNIATVIALCMGLSSIRFVLIERYDYALAAILAAAFFDAMDGKLARLLGASSDFGAELDSLSDFISFGVAPAIVIYVISLHTFNGIGWGISLIFAVCQALRLARFNTALRSPNISQQPSWKENFFIGVPVPASAMIALLPIEIYLATDAKICLNPYINSLTIIGAGILAVSRLPTFSLKNSQIPRKKVLPVMLIAGGTVAAMLSDLWSTVSCLVIVYLCVIPFSVRNYQKKLAFSRTLDKKSDTKNLKPMA